jgi:predicted transcriptional regulator
MSDNPDRDRAEGGQYSEEITLDETLSIFSDHEPRTAKEVAEELGCVRRTAYNKLSELADRGEIEKKKVGGRAVVWWKP